MKPVLAFTNRKPPRRPDDLPIFQKIARIHYLMPEVVTVLENAADHALAYYESKAPEAKARNVGKPVITIDRDDREGA